VIHHSGHGCPYTSIAFGLRCQEARMQPSMGDAYDNAPCESFFATLERELLDRRRFADSTAARAAALLDHLDDRHHPRRAVATRRSTYQSRP
jgi:putative transposase